MADAALRADFADFLYDKQGQAQQTFAKEYPLLAELSGALNVGGYDPGYRRYDRGLAELQGDRDTFDGEQIRFPLQLSDVSAAGTGEGVTFPAAFAFNTAKATLTLAEVIAPISISLSLGRDSGNPSTSALKAIAAYIDSAYRAAARLENDFCHGNGDGMLASSTSANADADGLVMTVATTTNFDQLTPGRIVNVLSVTGVDPGQGKRREIASVDRSAHTVTFKTGQVASDGGTGNITLSTNDLKIFADSSFGRAGQGLGQAVTVGGTAFEGIDVATVTQWTAVAYAANAALSDSVLRHVAYLSRGNGPHHDLAVGHDLVIDLYLESKASQVRYTPQDMVLKSGFNAAVYQGGDRPIPLMKDPNAPRQKLRILDKSVIQLYGDAPGPGFIDDDGTMWRFPGRNNLKEAWLYDRYQLGFKDLGKLAEITGLSEAA